jgi:uncharacterized protein YndB with AHSA1/START domain
MTGTAREGARILGSLGSEGGRGTVRVEAHIDADVDSVWSALTDPARLAHWYGAVDGDLRPSGTYRARLLASGWEGTGRVEACEPPTRLVSAARSQEEPNEHVTEVTLTAKGDRTVLAVEQQGLPLPLLAAYGAGLQVHVEDLAAHLAGRERCDADARWHELHPGYARLAAELE